MPQKKKTAVTPKGSPPKSRAPVKTDEVTLEVEKTVRSEPGIPTVGIGALAGELEALRESEERNSLFQGILRSTSDGILAVNLENEVVFANERFVEMWRIPQEIMASKDDTLLLQYVLDQLSDPQGFLQKVQELYNSAEESYDTLYFKDGRVFDRLSRSMLQKTNRLGRVWSFRDISERKQIEEALAASEAELRALFASMQDAVLAIDREGVYRKIAPTNPGLLVKPPEELLGKNLKDVFPAEKAEAFQGVVQQVLDTKQNAQIEYELLIGDRSVWFQTTISPLESDSTLWVAHDITKRKQVEEALRVAEANFRSIFENATVGIFQSTPQGRFLSVNPVMARIFGYDTPEEMAAGITNIEKQDYVDPADRHEFQRLMIEQGEAREFTSWNYRKNGERIWTQESARAVKDAQGNILYYEGFLSDITERKRADDELRTMKESLESANRELQQSLAHEQLLARTDSLTGLCNRRQFFELAEREFNAAVRYQRPLSILMFDADDFKQVNDIFGHAEGDNALTKIAQVAAVHVRAVDVLARYGGDEFVLLLPQADAQQVLLIAERIRSSVAATIHVGANQSPFTVTLSIGIAELQRSPVDEDIERVIQRADEALYAAKAKGRNRIMIFNSE